MKSYPAERRRRLTHRALPALGGLAAVSLVAGAFVGAKVNSASETAAADFVAAWQQGDFRAMHELLTADAKERYPLPRFRRAYERAAATATLRSIDPSDPERLDDGQVTVRSF